MERGSEAGEGSDTLWLVLKMEGTVPAKQRGPQELRMTPYLFPTKKWDLNPTAATCLSSQEPSDKSPAQPTPWFWCCDLRA